MVVGLVTGEIVVAVATRNGRESRAAKVRDKKEENKKRLEERDTSGNIKRVQRKVKTLEERSSQVVSVCWWTRIVFRIVGGERTKTKTCFKLPVLQKHKHTVGHLARKRATLKNHVTRRDSFYFFAKLCIFGKPMYFFSGTFASLTFEFFWFDKSRHDGSSRDKLSPGSSFLPTSCLASIC